MYAWKPLGAIAITALLPFATLSAQPAKSPAPRQFTVLHASDFQPTLVLPPPPARGSEQEKLELAQLHTLIADASPARLEQAKWDDAHEDPALFDEAIGMKLEALPATWALLTLVQHEGDTAADGSKVYFARIRPWGVDATLPNCDAGAGKKPTRSYPSGHATLGYSVGTVLARLMPDKAGAIMARATDYALSRQICGVHFPSDTEASHALGSVVATRLLLDPAMQPKIEAARNELAHLGQ